MGYSIVTKNEFKLLVITIAIAICGSLGVDIHLASLPHIMVYMHTTKQAMQQSVTLFILGVGLSILVYGPLSDKLGRRHVVIFGLCLACVASFAAAFTKTVEPFLALRFLQGVGSGVCWGLGRIIAADVMQGERLAAIGSYFTLFLSLSPLLAPALGGYIQHWFGWQANFVLLGVVILVVLLLVIFFLDETNKHKRPDAFSIIPLFKTYLSFFSNRLFVGCILLTGLAMSASLVYTTISSFIFQEQFHVSPIQFGWLTAIAASAGVIAKLISPLFILTLKNRRTLIMALSLLFLSGVFLTISNFLHLINIPVVLVGVGVAIFGLVFIGSITMAMALSPFHDKRGSAGALFGSFQLLISFAFSAIVACFPHYGTSILALSYLVLGVLGLVCYMTLVRSSKN